MRRLRAILIAMSVLAPVFLPAAAFAQSGNPLPCTCFCATKNGAIPEANKMLPDVCTSTCTAKGDTVAVCAAKADQFPGFNPFCYDEAECTGQLDPKTGDHTSRWDTNFQPPECLPGKHYCYPISRANIDLSFHLGSVSKVSDLGNYISVAYNVLLGIGTTIAIVSLMVGGFQYVLGAGAPEQMTKAKGRMRNAVYGLVLLFGAYVILFTVNPQLVKLEAPQLRETKGIAFISSTSDCTALKTSGCVLKEATATKGRFAPGFCGSVAEVQSCPNQQVQPGTTCQFYLCNGAPGVDEADTAVCVGQGDKAQCISCANVSQFSSSGFKPSESSCNLLKLPETNTNEKNYCWYSGDVDTIGHVDATVGAGSCAELRINCQSVRTCQSYDEQPVRSEDNTTLQEVEPGEGASTNLGFTKLGGIVDQVNIETICKDDPCGVGGSGGPGNRCLYDDRDGHCKAAQEFNQ